MKWMIVEPLDFDELGNTIYRFISWKKKEKQRIRESIVIMPLNEDEMEE